jgi:glucuronoarabinoxylan endo-1,4-beta-xylanase
MKNIFLKLSFIIIGSAFFISGCSDDQQEESDRSYASFLQDSLVVSSSAGAAIAIVESKAAQWEIVIEDDKGVIANISCMQGGSLQNKQQFTQIKFYYSENISPEPRFQEILLLNKTSGERCKLIIKQNSKYSSALLNLYPSVKYQPVAGFGGMYNPKIWMGQANLITNDEIAKMYDSEGLGYNILRLMVYPNEADWSADVEGAKLAQQHGALIIASPWDCTDALAEKINVNNKEFKHLKHENYQAYAEHLVRYIHFMKNNGVNLYGISVQNEPDMDFTYWYPDEIVNFVKEYGEHVRATGVKLMAPEACGFQPEYTDPILNDPNAFANTDILCGHLYQGFIDLGSSYVKARHDYICSLYSKLFFSSKPWSWWMTEHLFNEGQDETDPSLWKFQKWSYNLENLGKEIHICMEGYCSAYIYWYLKRFYGMIGDNDSRSSVAPGEVTKNGYIMAHYAQYASNMTRIRVETGNPELLATAYINDMETEITVVLLNMKTADFKVQISSPVTISNVSAVETTEDKNMVKAIAVIADDKQAASVLISAQSIVSIRLKLK